MLFVKEKRVMEHGLCFFLCHVSKCIAESCVDYHLPLIFVLNHGSSADTTTDLFLEFPYFLLTRIRDFFLSFFLLFFFLGDVISFYWNTQSRLVEEAQ